MVREELLLRRQATACKENVALDRPHLLRRKVVAMLPIQDMHPVMKKSLAKKGFRICASTRGNGGILASTVTRRLEPIAIRATRIRYISVEEPLSLRLISLKRDNARVGNAAEPGADHGGGI